MDLGHALAGLGANTAAALAWDAFAVPGAPPRHVTGDFDADALFDPDGPLAAESQFVRRYHISLDGTGATENGSKGSIDGGERRMEVEALVPWVRATFPQVTELNRCSVFDVFYVLWPGTSETVYAHSVYPWLLAHNAADGHVSPGGGSVAVGDVLAEDQLGPRLDALDKRLGGLEASIAEILRRLPA